MIWAQWSLLKVVGVYTAFAESPPGPGGNVPPGPGSNQPPASSSSIINQTFVVKNPLGACGKVECVVDIITDALFWISIPAATIMILYGAFLMLTSAGNTEKVEKGRDTIFWAVAGFVIVILGRGLVLFIEDLLGVKA